jgi:hypothetical protein
MLVGHKAKRKQKRLVVLSATRRLLHLAIRSLTNGNLFVVNYKGNGNIGRRTPKGEIEPSNRYET